MRVESQVPIQIQYKGQLVGDYVADIVVEDQVILELKAVNQPQTIHEAQLLNYLKQRGLRWECWLTSNIRRRI